MNPHVEVPIVRREQSPTGTRVTVEFPATGTWVVGRWLLLIGVVLGALAVGNLRIESDNGVVVIPDYVARPTGAMLGWVFMSWVLVMFGAAPARVVLEKGKLLVWQAGLLWAQSRVWSRDMVTDIKVGESSIGGGDDSMHPEVKICLANGETFGFLRGRYPPELDRTVQLLREELRLRS